MQPDGITANYRGDAGSGRNVTAVLRCGLRMSYQPGSRDARRGREVAHCSWATLVAAAGLAISVPPLAAQDVSADSSGILTGTLTGVENGEPIPYATLSLTGNGRASFADATGAFRLARLVPGTYALRARQIGYSPLDTTVVIDPGPGETTVKLRLHRIAIKLAEVGIHGRRPKGCVATGVPDSIVDPTLAAVFTQVRENVDRFQILLDQYPFTFSREERRVLRRDPGGDSTRAVDTVGYESRARRPYRVGGVIYLDFDAAGRRERFMYLPNFRDLADPAFLSAHCFAYGGTQVLGGADGTKVIRIDFRPASRISAPDVEGAIYLDATRFIVRRAVFRMTRPQAAHPPLMSLTVTTTFRELVPLVPVFDSVESVQELPPMIQRTGADGLPGTGGLSGHGGDETIRQSAVELDRLLEFTFEQRTPGEQGTGSSPPAAGSVASTQPAMIPTSTSASSAAPATLVTGRVVEADGTPVVGATIALFGFRDTVTTGDSGRFTLPGGAPGPHMLVARRTGFEVAHIPITVVRDQARAVTVTLARGVPVRTHLRLPSTRAGGEPGESGGTRARPVFPNIAMCEPAPAADTMRVLLSATLQSTPLAVPSDTAWSRYVDGVLAAVRSAFVMPSDLPIPAFGYPFRMSALQSAVSTPGASQPSLAAVPTLSGVIAFTLDSSGTAGGLRVAGSSLSGPADTSVLAAISAADAAHAFPATPQSVRSRGAVHFDLIVSTIQSQETPHSTVLGHVFVPIWSLRRAVSIASGTQPNLAAESDPIRAGTDSVALEFVVDDRGRAVMSSVRELSAGRDAAAGQAARVFRSRVIRALPGFRFDPALIGACPVPEMVTTGFAMNGVVGVMPGIK